MSYISDKIAEVRGAGHVVPEGIEELFLAIEEEIGLDKKQKKDEPRKLPAPQNNSAAQSNYQQQAGSAQQHNPLDGERLDS